MSPRRVHLLTLAVAVPYTAGGLMADRYVDRAGQLLLGLLTAAVLAVLLALHRRAVRVQTLGVVVFATAGEVLGSLVWGLYSYRLENLPTFVPPGHGLVFLCGLSLAGLAAERHTMLLGACAVAASAWGLGGLTVPPARDTAGAIGCAFLVAVLVKTRNPIYAGVFVVVAALELYGTAIGTWTWEGAVPGLGLSQGNPPSGVASGYVVFDILALALATRVSRLWVQGIPPTASANAPRIQQTSLVPPTQGGAGCR